MSMRLAALAGAVFFVLFIIYGTLTSNTPSVSASGNEVFDYFVRHHERIQLAAVVMALAMPAVLLWLSGLFRALSKADGRNSIFAVAALGGGILAAAMTATGALVAGTLAARFNDLGPSGARVWWTMYLLSLGATLLGLLLVLAGSAVVSLQKHLFPRWFAVASVVLALVSLVGACTIGYANTGIWAVAGIAVILDSVWILLVSLYFWRDRELALS
jgi:hypothetical protein